VSPLQGSANFPKRKPKALPWAFSCRPFGAKADLENTS
jgi:hypothetical protein